MPIQELLTVLRDKDTVYLELNNKAGYIDTHYIGVSEIKLIQKYLTAKVDSISVFKGKLYIKVHL
ncbi:MAG: hypothetical protein J6T15_05040 [Bacilli bacterium]|nr:hypothetical protein [Bacilli bacterium]